MEIKREANNKPRFANHIDTDILTAVETSDIRHVVDNNVKCSKSVVPNALYFAAQGKSVEFCLGTLGMPFRTLIGHCWIECDGQVIQTGVPTVKIPGMKEVKPYKNFSVKLPANNVDVAKKTIQSFVEDLRNFTITR